MRVIMFEDYDTFAGEFKEVMGFEGISSERIEVFASLSKFKDSIESNPEEIIKLREEGAVILVDHELLNNETGEDVVNYFREQKIPSHKIAMSSTPERQTYIREEDRIGKLNYLDNISLLVSLMNGEKTDEINEERREFGLVPDTPQVV